MTNPLKDDFASFAEHAAAPDMHAKVLARSRSLGVRRAVAGGVTALVVLLGGITGAFAVAGNLPGGGADDAASQLTGTFYYLDRGGSQGATRVLSWKQGDDKPTVVLEGDDTLRSTATVSPDGRHIAWREPIGDGGTANLLVKDLETGTVTTLMEAFQYLPCAEPVWTPDSKSILVGRQPLGEGIGVSASYVDLDEPLTFGDVVEIPGCHPRFVADGDHSGQLLFWGDSQLAAMTATGGESSVDTANVDEILSGAVGRTATDIVSVRHDGSLVCLSTDLETVDRAVSCDAVVGLPGGEVVKASDDFTTSYVFAGDGIIARSGGVLRVLDASGAELGTITEPSLNGDAQLLSYNP